MRRYGAVVLAALVVAAPAGAQARIGNAVRQVLVVSSPAHDGVATFAAYARPVGTSPFKRILGPWHAEIGFGHLRARRHEGDGSTPTGVFGIGGTIYGNQPDPGELHYRYHHLVCGDWWDENPYSPQYNRFVHVACGTTPAFASGSEALWTETTAYPYFAVIRFNVQPVRRGPGAPGSGIFLHSWVGGPTAGCVALPQRRLLAVLRWLRPAAHPVIAIGGASP